MEKKIEIAPYAPLLIYQKGDTPKFVYDTIRKYNLQGLRIFAYLKDTRLTSLNFLTEFAFLESLHVSSVDDFDFDFLKNLVNLKELSLGVEGNNKIDLSKNVNLERLYINWRKNITGIESCKNLKVFSLYGYKESDLSKFISLTGLTKLIIKTCSLQSLSGINAFSDLQNLLVANCRKLTSVKDLNGLTNLACLEFNSCTKLKDFSSIDNLPNLKKLYLTDCKEVLSIKFIKNFPLLEELAILGNTDIVDGDTLPAKDIKNLTYNHRRHYNVKIETPEADAREKRNVEKIRLPG